MVSSGVIGINGVNLEYRWCGSLSAGTPVLVFLHEGLVCVALWRDFPDLLSQRTGCAAVVYSRAGYGKSDPVSLPRPVRFMHDEAQALERLLDTMGICNAVMVGHSDGASIAIIHAGQTRCGRVRGLLLEAPHVFTEPEQLESIARIGQQYRLSDLRNRLSRYHGTNTDIAFRGWNEVWLDPEFRSWNIEEYLAPITAPVLIVQGDRDEYGSMRQIEALKRQLGGVVEFTGIENCGHSAHREYPEATLDVMTSFIHRNIVNGRS